MFVNLSLFLFFQYHNLCLSSPFRRGCMVHFLVFDRQCTACAIGFLMFYRSFQNDNVNSSHKKNQKT